MKKSLFGSLPSYSVSEFLTRFSLDFYYKRQPNSFVNATFRHSLSNLVILVTESRISTLLAVSQLTLTSYVTKHSKSIHLQDDDDNEGRERIWKGGDESGLVDEATDRDGNVNGEKRRS